MKRASHLVLSSGITVAVAAAFLISPILQYPATPIVVSAASKKARPKADVRQPIAILEYHHIREFSDKHDGANYYTSVAPDLFEKQLKALKKAGYTSISPEDYRQGKATPKSIIFTFDDGDADAYTVAYPLLKKYGYSGVFYLIYDFLDSPDYMTKDQAREMAANGMIIGSHTLVHTDFTKVSSDIARIQLSESKTKIEALIGKPVTDFCYPFGGVAGDSAQLVQEAGYLTAVTTAPPKNKGMFDNLETLPRIAVVPSSKPTVLLNKIARVRALNSKR